MRSSREELLPDYIIYFLQFTFIYIYRSKPVALYINTKYLGQILCIYQYKILCINTKRKNKKYSKKKRRD